QQRLLSHVAAQQAANRARPLVLIVQSAEEVGSPALKDLLGALLLDYSRFPACLVLCCCKPAPLFLAGLPEACRARLAPQVLQLPSQEERLERLFQDLLGSSAASPCVLLSQRPLRAALQRYEHLGAGVQGLLAALQAAH
ncbi:ORC_WH_C domain-containing protein, partial [Haematococcus lacustris]